LSELGAEYITWVMDDHPLKAGGASMRYASDYAKLWSNHLYGARKIYVISDAMRVFYRDYFGVEAEVLHGAVSLRADPVAAPAPRGLSEILRLGYAGSLSGWQKDPLELLAEIARGAGAELHVAGHGAPAWLHRAAVTLRGELPPDEAQRMLSQCDAVILPVSFTPEHTAMSRLNIATKLSELCACGRPILAIGPADAAMVRVLAAHEAAVCVTTPSKEALSHGLQMVRDWALSRRVVANARRLFEHELNLEEMQRRWRPGGDWLLASSAL
jgi:glycosyltransferase involved in cell wall biosynthesis